MRRVLLALLPAIAVYTWWFGWGLVVQIVLASATALLCEGLVCWLRKRPAAISLADTSALVTAWLLALCLPSLAPWWLTVTGAAFAILVVKQMFGGLGANIFNPAMAAYAALLVSFPLPMTTWPQAGQAPGPVASLAVIFSGPTATDSLSGATPLDYLKTQRLLGETATDVLTGAAYPVLAATASAWLVLAYLLGGAWLLWRGTIRWHIPAATLGTLLLASTLFHLLDPAAFTRPDVHLLSGAIVFGALFIATDPVTAPASPGGQLVFGAGIGLLVYVIRTWGGYPDAVAFAVLLMNMCVPVIDHFTAPRVFGRR